MIIFCLSHFCFGGYGYKFWLLLVLQTLKLFLKIVCQSSIVAGFCVEVCHSFAVS